VTQGILVINAGSTSVKFAACHCGGPNSMGLVCRGRVEGIGSQPTFVVKESKGKPVDAHDWEESHPLVPEGALRFVITWLETQQTDLKIAAVGHRVVHGGLVYESPVLVDETVISELEKLETVEPSHQPFEVDAIKAVARAPPKLRQVAVFDTAFHRSMPPVAQRYALPPAIAGDLIRHWGFHGISYDYLSRALPRYAPTARRAIVAHLGGGASMCALLDGKSMDISMGFSAIEGLPMSTRCGAIDPDIPVVPNEGNEAQCDGTRDAAVQEVWATRSFRHQRRHAHAERQQRAIGSGGDRLFRLPDCEVRRRLYGRAWRPRRFRVHRRHRRE
jgi:acetate kinase